MITQTFPSIRKSSFLPFRHKKPQQQQSNIGVVLLPPPKGYSRNPSQSDDVRAKKLNITPLEVVRRDDIVKEKAQNLFKRNIHKGMTVYPASKADYEIHGAMKVTHIYTSYHDFNLDEVWPHSDNPFVLTLVSLSGPNKDKVSIATENWVSANNPANMC